MKRIIVLLLCCSLTGCATMKRHPLVFGLVGGVAAGAAIGIATHVGHCASVYDGRPYSGTPPCPSEKGGHK